MDLGLKDRVAFVAGSSRGIGKAIAAAFLAEGCRTVVTGRTAETLRSTAAGLEQQFTPDHVMAVVGDLTDLTVIRKMLAQVRERWGGVDCAVANIGTGSGKPGWNIGEDDWNRAFDMNLWATVRLVTELLPAMTAHKNGSIVIISSIAGIESTAAPAPYGVAKAALVHYAKTIARQVGSYNVRINCIAPGNILFAGGSWDRHIATSPAKVADYIRTEVPLQRFGKPEEVADAVVFLSSDRASFITGACLIADGGQTRRA